MLRSVWYLFAFAGVLAVALLLPATPDTAVSMEGGWRMQASRPVADLPPGRYELLVTGSRYALHYDVEGPDGGAEGIELGQLLEEDGSVLLQPDEAAYRQADGIWSSDPRPARRLQVTLKDGRLALADAEGDELSGRESSGAAGPR
jgi:hypothetical protein